MGTLCFNKAAYDTAAEAKAVIRRRQRHEHMRLYAYKCQDPRCPYYHITKRKPPREWIR